MARDMTYRELRKHYKVSITDRGDINKQAPDDLLVPGWVVAQLQKTKHKKARRTLI